jgi:hypothetical protein
VSSIFFESLSLPLSLPIIAQAVIRYGDDGDHVVYSGAREAGSMNTDKSINQSKTPDNLIHAAIRKGGTALGWSWGYATPEDIHSYPNKDGVKSLPKPTSESFIIITTHSTTTAAITITITITFTITIIYYRKSSNKI